MPFEPYKLLILADDILIDEELKEKLTAYLAGGGRLILSGDSGLDPDKTRFVLDTGCEYEGVSPYQPDYLTGEGFLRPDYVDTPIVMYLRSRQARVTDGRGMCTVTYPEFNRTWEHFCSHQHAPAGKASPYPGAVLNNPGNILWYAHPIFEIYGSLGATVYKELAVKGIEYMLPDKTLAAGLPSTARATLTRQPGRLVLHLLNACIVTRGAEKELSPEGFVRPSHKTEVIEDLIPLYNTPLAIRLPERPATVRRVPEGTDIPYEYADGLLQFVSDSFVCHDMIEITVEE